MNDDSGLLDRLIGAALGDADEADRLALVERLFSALPTESQERLLRELLQGKTTDQETPPPRRETPSSRPRRPRPPLLWEAGENLPLRDIGPWRMCCNMMAAVDQAATVDDVDPELPAEVFSALGDETRIKIIRLLQDGEMRVEDIAKALDVPQSTLSHHLRVLRTAGLVRVNRRGRSSFYSLAQPEEAT